LESIALPPLLAALLILTRVVRGDAAVARTALAGLGFALAGAIAGLALGADRLSGSVAAAAALIAIVTAAYAARAMHGGSIPYARFFGTFVLTATAALAVAAAADLRVLAAAWVATGLGTTALLASANDRPAARGWARRHALIELIGDLAWLVVLALAWRTFGSFELHTIAVTALPGAATTTIALGLVVAGAARSALVPLHDWLPNSMEAPTPVSAFMHAGLVNGAGILLAKTAAILIAAPAALLLAATLGGLTAALGSVMLLVRPEAKRRLGWSTVAQMGFMVLQCGCGGFAGAVVHLIAHGGYKSTAFLSVPGAIVARRDAGRRPLPASGLNAVSATAYAIGAPLAGLVAAALIARTSLAGLPAAPLVVAMAAATGAAAARAVADRPIDLRGRILGFAAVAAGVAAYLLAAVGLDAFVGAGLPRTTFWPAASVAAALIIVAGLVAAFGLRPSLGARGYALALGEGRPVPVPAA
jgi:NADH:ubiquinone oxidoreductase subunit 5 (subunit L)/multisubunit Na+/H+ antiporter MnhA subunit